MTRITAHTIRLQMERLREQLEALQHFTEKGYSTKVCDDDKHNWVELTEYAHHYFEETYVTTVQCTRCGVIREWSYDFVDSREDDHFAEFREEEEEEFEETTAPPEDEGDEKNK